MIKYLILLIVFCSCYNERKANQQFNKAALDYPKIASDYCAKTFPVKEVTKSDTITHTDTVVMAGTVTVDTLLDHDTVRITRTVTLPGATIIKTVEITDTVIKENKAALASCEIDKNKLTGLLVKKTAEYDAWSKKAHTRFYIMWGLILAIVGYTGIKIYSLFKPKLA